MLLTPQFLWWIFLKNKMVICKSRRCFIAFWFIFAEEKHLFLSLSRSLFVSWSKISRCFLFAVKIAKEDSQCRRENTFIHIRGARVVRISSLMCSRILRDILLRNWTKENLRRARISSLRGRGEKSRGAERADRKRVNSVGVEDVAAAKSPSVKSREKRKPRNRCGDRTGGRRC